MKTLLAAQRHASVPEPALRPSNRPSLTRTFIATGDERCPIAGIWSRLTETDANLDDPESTRPARWSLLSWRAFSLTPHTASLQ